MAQISDWAFTAETVIDELAVGDLMEPSADSPLADRLRQLPRPQAAPGDPPAAPQSLLAAAALQLPSGQDQDQACTRLLDAAEQLLAARPAGQEIASRLAAAQIRFALARRSGDLAGVRSAAAAAAAAFASLPDDLRTRHPRTDALVLFATGTADLWSGNLAAAAAAFRAAMAVAPPGSYERAACQGHLALIEALHGQLNRAAELAAAATAPPFGRSVPAAAVALAVVHLQRHEPAAWHRRLRHANATLQARPDRLTSALASLAAARAALAESRGPAAADLLRRARAGWSPPPWLDHLLTVTESRVHAAAGDVQTALDAAARAKTLGTGGLEGAGPSLAARVAGARAWLATGDLRAARQALAGPVGVGVPDLGTLIEAHVTGALISYRDGDATQGRRSLERAMRLGEPAGYRLPFITDWAWIRPVLCDDPDLSGGFSKIVAQPADAAPPDVVITEQLSDRELEVLQRAAAMYSTDEIAGELFISVNTVKTHLKSIYRKLGAAGRRDAVRRARELKLI
jgi:LuxR family maltose regulon positive regulatory protein